MENDEKYRITDEQIKEFQKTLTHYRVCRVRCKQCGDILEHTFYTKEMNSCRMMTCSCGKVQLDPHIFAYRILGYPADYEDLSEVWPDKLDYYIWKAKHQRGLKDEQIKFFLQNYPRWELLPHYACYVKKMGEQGALEQIKQEFGSGT